MEESLMEAFEPPEAGTAPAGVKAILKKVYNGCRATWVAKHPGDKENADNKTTCSQVAWAAVRQAGWKKVEDVWKKEHVDMENFFVTTGDVAGVKKMEGRKSRQRELADEVLSAHRRLLVEGGPGSGNFGHAGRPGMVGGSGKGQGGGGGKSSEDKGISAGEKLPRKLQRYSNNVKRLLLNPEVIRQRKRGELLGSLLGTYGPVIVFDAVGFKGKIPRGMGPLMGRSSAFNDRRFNELGKWLDKQLPKKLK